MSASSSLARTSGPSSEAIERVLVEADLGALDPKMRVAYYTQVCASLGLNPLTRPFEYLRLNGKTILYANRACSEQLRLIHKVSVKLIERRNEHGVYSVTAMATTPDGREDTSTGVVPIDGLRGENLANAMMKAETKAKRRVTLSICGMGMLDESEVDAVRGAQRIAHDPATGEVFDAPAAQLPAAAASPRPVDALAAQTYTKLWAAIQNAPDLDTLKKAWTSAMSAQKGGFITLEQRAQLMDAKDARKAELTRTKTTEEVHAGNDLPPEYGGPQRQDDGEPPEGYRSDADDGVR